MSKRKEIDTVEELSASKRTRLDAVPAASMTWLLLYFGSAIGCDMPILEALFCTVTLPCQSCKKRVDPADLRWQTCPSCRELRPCMLCYSRNDELYERLPNCGDIHFLDTDDQFTYGFYHGCHLNDAPRDSRYWLCPVHALLSSSWGSENPLMRLLPSEIGHLFNIAQFCLWDNDSDAEGSGHPPPPPIGIIDDGCNSTLTICSPAERARYDPLHPFAILKFCLNYSSDNKIPNHFEGYTYTDQLTKELAAAEGNEPTLQRIRQQRRAANLSVIAQIQPLVDKFGDGLPEPSCPPLACSRCATALTSASNALSAKALSHSADICCSDAEDLCGFSYHVYDKTELFCDKCALK